MPSNLENIQPTPYISKAEQMKFWNQKVDEMKKFRGIKTLQVIKKRAELLIDFLIVLIKKDFTLIMDDEDFRYIIIQFLNITWNRTVQLADKIPEYSEDLFELIENVEDKYYLNE